MNIEEIKEILTRYYDVEDDYDMEKGCYVNDKWLSLQNIIDLLERNI